MHDQEHAFLLPIVKDTQLYIYKENGSGEKVVYFVLNHIILIIKCFFTSAYFSPFDLKSLLNQKFSNFVFVIDKLMFHFFQMLLGYNFPRIGNECNKNMN